MTNSDFTIANTETEAHRTGQTEEIHNAHPSSTQQHGKHIRIDEWTSSKQPLLSTTEGNASNFGRTLHAKGNSTSEEFTRQLNHLAVENNSYLKAAYPNPNSYYGWLPGLNSVRFPAFIYPPSFVGFAPTLAWMRTNSSSQGQPTSIEKIDRWLSGKKDTIPSQASPCGKYTIDTDSRDEFVYASEATKEPNEKSSNSDEDEGLVLDERETIKRNRQKESAKLHTDSVKPRCEQRSSVIQPNISIQPKPSVIMRHGQNAATSTEQEENRPAKRGRASTRQIEKTEQYWDRRKKNNVSAKKSRDARRQREAVMNQRSSMLETENLRLRAELATLRDENTRLKQELGKLKSPT